jgi:hypothetical protein
MAGDVDHSQPGCAALPSGMRLLVRLAATGGAVSLGVSALGAQGPPPAPSFPRLSLVGAIGQAFSPENHFTDLALTGGLRLGRAELRLRVGTLAALYGCAAIVPSRCAAGGGPYADASLAVHLGRSSRSVGGPTVAVGPGLLRDASRRGFIGAAVGWDLPLGHRGVVRIEVHGRQLFDRFYRDTWGEPDRQYGVRIGIGLWSAVDRL